MASIPPLGSSGPQRLAMPPECAACGARMQLFGVEPHSKFMRLETHRYGCACGRTSEEAVPREA
jgi:hypothetical protein